MSPLLNDSDKRWWLEMEDRVREMLVDLGPLGFAIDHHSYRKGWTDDARCLLRREPAEALCRARDRLPSGLNFKVFDGWRPWEIQQVCARDAEERLRQEHPDWSDEQVAARVRVMAPPSRIVPRLASHRYGGAVDVTIIDGDGNELDMGVRVGHVSTTESDLLHYELLESEPGSRERLARDNRRLLIRSLGPEGFAPYLAEFWHWDYSRDL
jgi:zinc D-Ala-D-Ala dipeptidase